MEKLHRGSSKNNFIVWEHGLLLSHQALGFQCPFTWWWRMRSGDCGGKSLAVRTLWSFCLQAVVSKLHKDQTKGWSNFSAWVLKQPHTWIYHHHVSLGLQNTVVLFSLLFLSLHTPFCLIFYLDSSVNKTFFSHPLWNSGNSLPTSSVGLVSLLRNGLETAPRPPRHCWTAFWQEDFCWLESNTFIHWPQTAFQIGGAHQQRKWQLIEGWCRITSTTCAPLVIELLPQDLQ